MADAQDLIFSSPNKEITLLKVKTDNHTYSITFPKDCTLNYVRRKISSDLKLQEMHIYRGYYWFSLDGKDRIINEEISLNQLKFVTDNTIYIIEPKITLQISDHFNFTNSVKPPWTQDPSQTENSQQSISDPSKQSNVLRPESLLDPKLSQCVSDSLQTNSVSPPCKPHPLQDESVSILCDELHKMMIDTGFDNTLKTSNSSVSRYTYIAPLGPMISTNLICTSIGHQLIAHASLSIPNNGPSQVISCTLPINDFISTQQNDNKTDTVIHNSVKLKRVFRDAIPHRLLTNLRRALDLPESGTILCLSHEIKILIMRLLDVNSVLKLSQVNREFFMLSKDSYLWKLLLLRDFKKKLMEFPRCGNNESWKEFYVIEYKKEKKRQEQLSQATNIFQPPFFHSNPFPPFIDIRPPPHPLGGRVNRRGHHRRERFNPYTPGTPLIDPFRNHFNNDPFGPNFMSPFDDDFFD